MIKVNQKALAMLIDNIKNFQPCEKCPFCYELCHAPEISEDTCEQELYRILTAESLDK